MPKQKEFATPVTSAFPPGLYFMQVKRWTGKKAGRAYVQIYNGNGLWLTPIEVSEANHAKFLADIGKMNAVPKPVILKLKDAGPIETRVAKLVVDKNYGLKNFHAHVGAPVPTREDFWKLVAIPVDHAMSDTCLMSTLTAEQRRSLTGFSSKLTTAARRKLFPGRAQSGN